MQATKAINYSTCLVGYFHQVMGKAINKTNAWEFLLVYIPSSYISEGSVSHINSVWPVFLFEQLCLQLCPKKAHNQTHILAFFLDRTCVTAT